MVMPDEVPVRERLRRLPAVFRHCGWPLWLFGIGLVCDLTTTGLLFAAFGTDVELHPVIRFVGSFTGPWMAAVLGKLGQIAGLVTLGLFLERRGLRIAMAIAGIAYLAASAANLAQWMMA